MRIPVPRLRRPSAFGLFVLALCACAVTLALNALLSEIEPSTSWGIAYGSIALVLMLGAMSYAARRRAPRHGPGRAHAWLQWHIYGGTLFLALMLMHSGFRVPHGSLGWGMWLLSLYLVLSGLFGLMLQRLIPRALSSFATEVNYDRIPALVEVLRGRAEELVSTCDDAVQRFYETSLAPAFVGPQPRFGYLLHAAGGIQSRVSRLEHLRPLMAGDGQKLDGLKRLVASKLEMDAQYTLQRALRLWLLGHVPVTLMLLVLVGFHLFSVWYY